MDRFASGSLWTASILVLVGCSEPAHMEDSWQVLGADATAEVYTQTTAGARTALKEIGQAYETVDETMSNWRPDSELSRLNRRASEGVYAIQSRELYRCVKFALDYAKATDGAFDPTAGPLMRAYGFRPFDPKTPDAKALLDAMDHVGWEKVDLFKVDRSIRFRDPGVEIDLGGIARGYALDVAARSFARVGCLGGLLDVGGDVLAWNHPPDRDAWTIRLPDPGAPERPMATLEIANRAAATTGQYKNRFTVDGRTYGHVMNVAEGKPARTDVISATAIADSGADADAMSTALVAAGSARGADILRRSHRIEAVLFVERRDGPELLVSSSLKESLHVDPGFEERIGGRVRYILPPQSLETPSAPRFRWPTAPE